MGDLGGLSRTLVDGLFAEFGQSDINSLSIREVGKLVATIEQQSGVEFIHMEMGVPGLPASKIGTDAEKEALDKGLASIYPSIEGIPFAKKEIARFVKMFMDIEVPEACCIPTVGGMQGSFAALLGAARTNPEKPYTLFIDPGFPVNKSQLQLMGVPFKTFDILSNRGDKLREKLESYLKEGNICSICYSSPNNPAWISFSEKELQIIGELATKYDVIVVEDLAYFGMDFRQHYGAPGIAPFQPTVARYTDNYILIMSASKIFNYAGQRIGMMIIGDKIRTRSYPNLKNYFTSDVLGHFIPYGILYATTAGTSHTAQYALASMLKAANDGELDFVSELHNYGEKARKMKSIFLKHGFYIVYNDEDGTLADGFYFTIAYPDMTSGELMRQFLYYGLSAISLSITGSENQNGLRICVSFVRPEQIDELDKRLALFVKNRE
ncbi:pyridoxal phosphate-dependent aminotransferase [Paludibacter sp. 221]|nr:pyridoxal phosphate-dependent aminotransferase [Paludibacter sp. 221]NDV47153.1 pyridoxal phosphate-dependent aminotransferase [Paludibacter sp. 221]